MQHIRAIERAVVVVAVVLIECESQVTQEVVHGRSVVCPGDPLRDFTLGSFLDKFVFKNPKQSARTAGGSLMQPQARPTTLGLAHPAMVQQLRQMPLAKVAAHDAYLHTYFTMQQAAEQRRASKKRKRKKGDDDDASDDDDDAAAAAAGTADDHEDVGGAWESDDDDAEEEAFAQQLAEGLMQDDDDDDDSDDDDDAGGGFGGDDFGGDDDEDDDDDADAFAAMDGFGGGDDEDEDGGGGAGGGRKGGKRPKGGSSFADASEFAAMLDEAADPNEGVNPRLADWESGKRRSKKGRR